MLGAGLVMLKFLYIYLQSNYPFVFDIVDCLPLFYLFCNLVDSHVNMLLADCFCLALRLGRWKNPKIPTLSSAACT